MDRCYLEIMQHECDVESCAGHKETIKNKRWKGCLHQLLLDLPLFQSGTEKDPEQIIEIFGETQFKQGENDDQYHHDIKKHFLSTKFFNIGTAMHSGCIEAEKWMMPQDRKLERDASCRIPYWISETGRRLF